ncbi:RNA polymerase sigma factor [Cellulomonas gilvus]|uniref:RNA polymerase, sigma-24 subunit, ECF subfamily n=1 Tax=Cellulomonas gilvus (strain ATCC 13127 / NRRL B-14078) TaxID=593907 RepID=F8A4N3_CELGA|nr:sigma-70 family RNA polymerase sigma factor [Cellulomonas gilvus]AEI10849.1 RNA polymerase, sigma-24 subunit, ECF subfamily [Cellulomonas gilvus ATCC 13127]
MLPRTEPADDPTDDRPTPDGREADGRAADGPTGERPVPARAASREDEPDDERPAAPPVEHDSTWFTAVVRAHQRDLHRYLVRRAPGEADDLTADVLTIAWRRRDDVPDGAELPWLYRTAGFVLANHRRKGRPIPVERVPEEIDDDDPALRAVHDERVREALGALSPRDRQIVLLNAWEGLTGQALAEVLGIGRGGADAALSRARARLAAAWGESA